MSDTAEKKQIKGEEKDVEILEKATSSTDSQEEAPKVEAKKELSESLLDDEADLEEDVAKLSKHKKPESSSKENVEERETTSIDAADEEASGKMQKEEAKESIDDTEEDPENRKMTFEEKFAAAMKKPTKRRKKNEVDLEAMQDEAIGSLKNAMKDAAYDDIECVNAHKPATHKLRLLPKVKETLLKSALYDSILDNNMLEAVRIWLEPLPDGSLPSYEIQRTLINELTKLPIKTIHLRESGLGKVMVFYQRSPIVDPILKRTAEKLISDWTRPIMGRSDNYRAKRVPTASFNIEKLKADQRLHSGADTHKKAVRKTLYQESADRRKRAAAPEVSAKVYSIAPQVNVDALRRSGRSTVAAMGIGSSLSRDERFKRLNQKLTHLSQKKSSKKKGGVSIEGKGVNAF